MPESVKECPTYVRASPSLSRKTGRQLHCVTFVLPEIDRYYAGRRCDISGKNPLIGSCDEKYPFSIFDRKSHPTGIRAMSTTSKIGPVGDSVRRVFVQFARAAT